MKHFISDTHFNHAAVMGYSNRPFTSVEEMNESMTDAWNARVDKNDDVYHLGDVAFTGLPHLKLILGRLNGRIHVILGNHDKTLRGAAQSLISEGLLASVQDYKEVKHDGHTFVLSHYSHRTWNKCHYGSIHLYGHSHGTLPPLGRSLDVGVDDKTITPEYRPVTAEEVLEYMKGVESHELPSKR